MIEDYEWIAQQKNLVIFPFAELLKRTTLTNFTNIYSNLKISIWKIFVLLLTTKKGALPKKPVIAPFIEWYRTNAFRKFYE